MVGNCHSKIVDVESLVTTVKSNIHYFSWWLTMMKSNIHSHIVDMIYYVGMDITFLYGHYGSISTIFGMLFPHSWQKVLDNIRSG